MASIVLVSSIGLTTDRHFCGGQIKSYSLFGKAKTCYELVNKETQLSCVNSEINRYDGLAITKTPCCESKTKRFQIDADTSLSTTDFSPTQVQSFIVAFATVFNMSSLPRICVDYLNYKPPLIFRDVLVLIQSFLL